MNTDAAWQPSASPMVTRGSPSLALDARALGLLDELLDLDAQRRRGVLGRLCADQPELYARVVSLLHLSDADGGSRALAGPVVAGLKSALSSLRPGDLLADYRLLRELGRGGMSEVWLAERADGSLRREVALKLPLLPLVGGVAAQRFAQERDVLAQLVHPNIARLYDAGIAEGGQPFIVLEAVQGLPIDRYADEAGLGVRQRIHVFLQVLAAVEHAHQHMTVHRDLKPNNVLVTTEGQVKLLDFGIAKLLTTPGGSQPPADLTQSLGAMLTPRYAAPEQVLGSAVSSATDVYSAGVLLYELLTGTGPYGAADTTAAPVLAAALQGDPVPASRATFPAGGCVRRGHGNEAGLRRELRGDIDLVLGRALQKAPELRYASAAAFADDLSRICDSRPIGIRKPSLAHRARLMLRRHRMAAALIGGATVASITLAFVAVQQGLAERAQAARAAAVRDFMFEMVSDAEPDETRPGSVVTGPQIVDAAVARAHREFADRPLLQGELLGELGRIYARLDQRTPSVRTLSEAIERLEPVAKSGDPALDKARGHLARQLIDEDPARAEQLAAQALASCAARSSECAKARGYAHEALAMLENRRGQASAAMAHARAWVQETEAGFGPRDANTAAALQSLATLQRNEGRFVDASASIARALEFAGDARLRASARMGLLRMQGLLELDLGDYVAAQRRFTELAAGTRQDGERALLLRLLSGAHLGAGDPVAAMQAATEAQTLAHRDGDVLEQTLALQAQARAEALLGRSDTARVALAKVSEGLVALGFAPTAREVLRARRFAAEIRLRQGDVEGGGAELEAIESAHRAGGAGHGLEWAQALDLLGSVAHALGQVDRALKCHLESRSLLAERLPPGHPLLLRNEVYLARADPAGTARLATALERYRATLAPGSPARARIDAEVVQQGVAGSALGVHHERPLWLL